MTESFFSERTSAEAQGEMKTTPKQLTRGAVLLGLPMACRPNLVGGE